MRGMMNTQTKQNQTADASQNRIKPGEQIIITKSRDPEWPKWAVIVTSQFHRTTWHDSEHLAWSAAEKIKKQNGFPILSHEK